MQIQVLRGIGQEPLILEATLVIVYHNDGTPVMVSGEYGPDDTINSSHAQDPVFQQTLSNLGVTRTTICDTLSLPQPPPGAKLLRGPIWTPPIARPKK